PTLIPPAIRGKRPGELRASDRSYPAHGARNEAGGPTVLRRLMIVGGLWALFHVYVGQRLLAHAPLALGWRALGWGVIALLALAPFAAFFAARSRRGPLTGALERVGFTAMGLSSLLIVFVLAGDLLHLRAWVGAGMFAAGVVGGALVVLLLGSWRGRGPVGVGVGVPMRGARRASISSCRGTRTAASTSRSTCSCGCSSRSSRGCTGSRRCGCT